MSGCLHIAPPAQHCVVSKHVACSTWAGVLGMLHFMLKSVHWLLAAAAPCRASTQALACSSQ